MANDATLEGIVAEIWCHDSMMAEIAYDPSRSTFRVEFFPLPGGIPYVFDLADVEQLIAAAKEHLQPG
jgi:hypothetical protein